MINARIIDINNLEDAKKETDKLGVDKNGIEWIAPKALHVNILLEDISPYEANIIKQEMLGKGGDAAVHRGVVNCSVKSSNVLITGTYKQYCGLLHKLRFQSKMLRLIADEIHEILKIFDEQGTSDFVYRGGRLLIGKRTILMGILNVTPDSFSDGGKYDGIEPAVEQAKKMCREGADIIDVGGESTRPGHTPVDAFDEMERVIPVVERLVEELNVPISVDTSKAVVAEKALEAGAHIINDVWGLQKDPLIAGVVADFKAGVVIMHNRSKPDYDDLMGDILCFLRKSVKLAEEAGIIRNSIVIDPGIGFGKTLNHNLEIMKRLKELRSLNLPVLLGTSRKSLIGKTLDLPINERIEGTAATVTKGISDGADIIRVHDVKQMARVAKMTDAMVRL